jgi:hypothetical protein
MPEKSRRAPSHHRHPRLRTTLRMVPPQSGRSREHASTKEKQKEESTGADSSTPRYSPGRDTNRLDTYRIPCTSNVWHARRSLPSPLGDAAGPRLRSHLGTSPRRRGRPAGHRPGRLLQAAGDFLLRRLALRRGCHGAVSTRLPSSSTTRTQAAKEPRRHWLLSSCYPSSIVRSTAVRSIVAGWAAG